MMAATAFAETGTNTQSTCQLPDLSLVRPQSGEFTFHETNQAEFIDVESIAELYFVRRRAAQNAASLLEQRRQRSFEDDALETEVLVPVDALGTAKKVDQIRKKYGQNSPEHQQAQAGLLLDCERLIEEAMVNLSWGYFEEIPQYLDETGQNYMSHGMSTRQMTTNALSHLAEPEDQDRRVNEHVEEETNHAIPKIPKRLLLEKIGAVGLSGEVQERQVRTVIISPCPQYAIDSYERDQQRKAKGLKVSRNGYGGYSPQTKKLKIRSTRFDQHGTRWQSEFSLPGIYITDEVIQDVLKQKGALGKDEKLSKTQLQGKEWLTDSEEAVFEFVEQLDAEASRRSGKRIYLGEEVSESFVMNYDPDHIKAEARARQTKAEHQVVGELSDFVIGLHQQGVDSWVAGAIVEDKVRDMLLKVAKQDPDIAEKIFDRRTAEGFREVAVLESEGQYHAASLLQRRLEEEAPAVGFCGAGGCTIAEVQEKSSEARQARRLGVKGRMLKDKLSSCPFCPRKGVIMGLKGGKVSLACTNCGSIKSNGRVKQGNTDASQN